MLEDGGMDADDAGGYSDRYNVRICGFVGADIIIKIFFDRFHCRTFSV